MHTNKISYTCIAHFMIWRTNLYVITSNILIAKVFNYHFLKLKILGKYRTSKRFNEKNRVVSMVFNSPYFYYNSFLVVKYQFSSAMISLW
jgi:hypothetical protein